MKLKSIVIAFIVALASFNLIAQTKSYNSLSSGLSHNQGSISNDTLTSELKVDKNYWLPAVEVVGLNFGERGFKR